MISLFITSMLDDTIAKIYDVIDRRLLPIKLYYTFYYAATTSIYAFLSAFLRKRGFKAGDLTFQMAVVPFTIFWVKPLIGHLLDKDRRRWKFYLTIFLVNALLSMTLLWFFVPNLHNFHPKDASKKYIDKSNFTQSKLQDPMNFLYEEGEVVNLPNFLNVINALGLAWFTATLVLVVSGMTLGLSPSFSLMDVIAMETLGENIIYFGRQRMFMSVGQLCSILILSLSGKRNNFLNVECMFVVYFVGILFTLASLKSIQLSPLSDQEEEDDLFPQNRRASYGFFAFLEVLRNIDIWPFLVLTFVCGMNFGQTYWITIWHFEEIAVSRTVYDIGYTCVAMSSILFAYYSGPIINYLSYEYTFTLCLVCYTVRSCVWSISTHTWSLIVVEFLLGVPVGLWISAFNSYAKKVAPEGSLAFATFLFWGVYEGLGCGMGLVLSGFLHHITGGTSSWHIFAYINLAASTFYLSSSHMIKKRNARNIAERLLKPSKTYSTSE